jgi:leucyl aminopeptidase
MPPQVVPSDESAADISCDALVLGAFAQDGPDLGGNGRALDESLDGALSTHLRDAGFKGKVGEVALVPMLGRLPGKVVAVAGLGPRDRAGAAEARRAAGVAARKLSERPLLASTLHLDVESDDSATTAASTEGFLLGSYRFTTYKSDPHPSKIRRVLLPSAKREDIEKGVVLAEATSLARDLINEPAGVLTPDGLAAKAQELAGSTGLECTILDEQDLAREGFGGILGVAGGSVQPPRLVSLRYAPSGARAKLFLIGKGITFDSGGLSLKDAKNMEDMKTDMAGGAAVIAAMSALPRIAPSVEVVGLVPATENMPGGNAIKPGDVITHYGGHTSEVLNTDAEGRLILADALAYACEQDPDAVVDVATLTGSIVIALGKRATGLFSNNESLASELNDAASRAGERLWSMPLYDDYRTELESEIADIKNTASRWGGSIFAALFLRDFVKSGIPWAHLDIAGTARADSDYDEVPKGGTGSATRTLVAWIEGRGR